LGTLETFPEKVTKAKDNKIVVYERGISNLGIFDVADPIRW